MSWRIVSGRVTRRRQAEQVTRQSSPSSHPSCEQYRGQLPEQALCNGCDPNEDLRHRLLPNGILASSNQIRPLT